MVKKGAIYILSIFLFGISCQTRNTQNKMLFKCFVFPSGISSETYSIKVYEDGQFDVLYGVKTSSVDEENFDNVVKSKSVVLNNADIKNIKELYYKVSGLSSIEKGITRKGGWEIVLMTKSKRYHFYYGEYNNTPLGLLIEDIIRKSPILLNLHSWS
jgi:hypothetical protein